MGKLFLFTVYILISSIAGAGVLNDLKSVPATKYDIGKLRLEHGADVLTRRLKGQKIRLKGHDALGSSFDISSVIVQEFDGKLALAIRVVGKAKEMNELFCQDFVGRLKKGINFDAMAKEIWDGLSDEQYAALKEEFMLKVILVSKENDAFRVSCM
jgi:hypothetical protein